MSRRSTRYALGGSAIVAAGILATRARRRRDTIDLAGRGVLITGGSRGLGLLLAREFARAGCAVSTCARDALELRRARADLADRGADVHVSPCDVTDRRAVEHWVAEAEARLGRIDILVNNASVIQVGPLETMTLDDFERAMAANFWGTVHATLAVLPRMRVHRSAAGGTRRGRAGPAHDAAETAPPESVGRIVNIASIGGKVGVPHLLPYDCAKFAVLGFSQGLRAELAKQGIGVTTIVPGLMRTGSPVNALFKGKHALEFAWFSLGDALPFTSMNAERAARRIVEATRRGEGAVTLTWQARLLGLAHDLFPGVTTDLLGLVNRVLPGPPDQPSALVRGMKLASPLSPSPLTTLMNQAARRNNQYGGQATPGPEHAEKVGLLP